MSKSLHRILTVAVVAISFNASAGNSGRDASHCLSIKDNGKKYDNVVFTNTCSYNIFYMYCGDLVSSKKRCGDGANGYYTGSVNLRPGQSDAISIKAGGSYSYAACEGGVSWNSSKSIRHDVSWGGSYRCLRK